MSFELPPLPYPMHALEPYTSARTLEFHHGKHQQAYVTTLNKLTQDTAMANQSLEAIIIATANDKSKSAIFDSAAQVWNHTFFWNSMRPGGGGRPNASITEGIDRSFGSLDKFHAQFKEAATTEFGSGWAWLVLDGNMFKITKTSNAVNPLSQGQTALLTCDVWEHAYYLDYQNRRPDFIEGFLDHLLDWDFVARNIAKARQPSAA
jgi:superoxide dismutase, Fe-Mn family